MQASTRDFNGGGIYDSQNDFGLSTNTIVLFAFVLSVAIVLSYAYVWVARTFTKQFIWITGMARFCPWLTAAYKRHVFRHPQHRLWLRDGHLHA